MTRCFIIKYRKLEVLSLRFMIGECLNYRTFIHTLHRKEFLPLTRQNKTTTTWNSYLQSQDSVLKPESASDVIDVHPINSVKHDLVHLHQSFVHSSFILSKHFILVKAMVALGITGCNKENTLDVTPAHCRSSHKHLFTPSGCYN